MPHDIIVKHDRDCIDDDDDDDDDDRYKCSVWTRGNGGNHS